MNLNISEGSGVFFCDKCLNIFDIEQDEKGEDIFICKSCGNKKLIEPGTILISKGEEINDDDVNINKKKEAYALMHSSNYVCPNPKCPSHKTGKKDMIMEYNKLNSYKRRMICLICNTKWM